MPAQTPEFRPTSCARCGHELHYAVMRGRVKFFVREPSGAARQVKICPGCRQDLPPMDLDALVEQTMRTP